MNTRIKRIKRYIRNNKLNDFVFDGMGLPGNLPYRLIEPRVDVLFGTTSSGMTCHFRKLVRSCIDQMRSR